jgi:NADP-dependent 3-hydroxy acid dehydrogenase YdfG
MNDQSFRENVCIITGASSGIGRALALVLAEQGAWLALAARDEERLHSAAKACRELGGRALVVPTDVTDEGQCRHLIEQTAREYGRIDTLVNNAGISMVARFDDIKDLAPVKKIMDVNYYGSVYCTHYALPFLIQSKGRIVGVSSLTGKTGVPTRSLYAASKHAMAGFFDSLRIEMIDHGVTVTMIYPGFVASEVRERALGSDGKARGEDFIEKKDVMTAEKCAGLIARTAARRQPQLVMTLRGKLGQWLKLIAPALVDRIARRMVEREGEV